MFSFRLHVTRAIRHELESFSSLVNVCVGCTDTERKIRLCVITVVGLFVAKPQLSLTESVKCFWMGGDNGSWTSVLKIDILDTSIEKMHWRQR